MLEEVPKPRRRTAPSLTDAECQTSPVKNLESENGKLRLVLRSKRVARVAEFSSSGSSPNSLMSWYGPLFPSQKSRVVVYDYVFDNKQTKALDEARDLAKRTGLVLEVTDLSRQSALERALRLGLSRVGGAIVRLRLDVRALRGPQESSYERMIRQQACRP